MTLRLVSLLGLLLLAGVRPVAAQAPDAVRILGITATSRVAQASSGVNSLVARRLTKFVDTASSGSEAVLEINWRAPRAGLPAGAVVRLDYRRDDDPVVRRLEQRYGSAVTGDRTTRFAVPLAPGGRISSWRVQVWNGPQVAGERASASWR